MNPQFIAMELLSHLQIYKIIRPKYTTLQTIVSGVINTERKRLANIIQNNLTEQDTILLQSLLIEEDTLSKLAAIKQDAKDFKQWMMKEEKQKMETLKQIYQITKRLIPSNATVNPACKRLVLQDNIPREEVCNFFMVIILDGS